MRDKLEMEIERDYLKQRNEAWNDLSIAKSALRQIADGERSSKGRKERMKPEQFMQVAHEALLKMQGVG